MFINRTKTQDELLATEKNYWRYYWRKDTPLSVLLFCWEFGNDPTLNPYIDWDARQLITDLGLSRWSRRWLYGLATSSPEYCCEDMNGPKKTFCSFKTEEILPIYTVQILKAMKALCKIWRIHLWPYQDLFRFNYINPKYSCSCLNRHRISIWCFRTQSFLESILISSSWKWYFDEATQEVLWNGKKIRKDFCTIIFIP